MGEENPDDTRLLREAERKQPVLSALMLSTKPHQLDDLISPSWVYKGRFHGHRVSGNYKTTAQIWPISYKQWILAISNTCCPYNSAYLPTCNLQPHTPAGLLLPTAHSTPPYPTKPTRLPTAPPTALLFPYFLVFLLPVGRWDAWEHSCDGLGVFRRGLWIPQKKEEVVVGKDLCALCFYIIYITF